MQSEVDGILVAAHELKSPLSLMRQLALSIDENTTDKQLAKTKSQIVNVSERAMRQVDDLTKIANLNETLFPVEPVAVRTICDEVISELRHLYRFNHRYLNVTYSNRSKLVIANRELLFSVIYNFCINAMHYSDEQTKSVLKISDHQDKVRIDIRDFGPSLPMDVWRELKRGWINRPTSIAMRPGSSGLGLFIASKFASYMNAPVGAIRHRDGTSFFIELPISSQMSLI